MTLDLRALRHLATMAMPLSFEKPDAVVPGYAIADFKAAITPQVLAELLDLVEHRRSLPDLRMSMYLSRDEFDTDLVRREAEALVAYADKLGMLVNVITHRMQPSEGPFDTVIEVLRKDGAA